MQQIGGVWLPASDTHFAGQLKRSPRVDGMPTYQLHKYQAACRFVRRWQHAVDVGAHVGLWSRVMARDFAQVSAFEPVPALGDCFALNVRAANVRLFPWALGPAIGQVTVATPADNSGNAHVAAAGESGQAAHMSALDDVPLDPIDLLKIDVEGYEVAVISGGEGTIRRDHPVIVVEQKPDNAERYGCRRFEAVQTLEHWGARCAAVLSGDHVMVWDSP